MRLLTAAGLVVMAAGPVLAGYLVGLDAGDRMTVDGYREDGDRVHLLRGGVDLSVPRSRIRSVTDVSAPADAQPLGRRLREAPRSPRESAP